MVEVSNRIYPALLVEIEARRGRPVADRSAGSPGLGGIRSVHSLGWCRGFV
jgi:hypothetical protein